MFLLPPTRGIGEHLGAYRKCLETTYAQRGRIGALLEAAGQRCRTIPLCLAAIALPLKL